MGEQALELVDTEDMGQRRASRAWGEIALDIGPAARFGVKELQATRDLIAGTPRETALHQEMVQVMVDVRGVEAIGGASVEAGQAFDSLDRGRLGTRRETWQLHVVDHCAR
jgi:hypothetical protein